MYSIGVGGFVYNPLKKEVLVVKEKNGPIKVNKYLFINILFF